MNAPLQTQPPTGQGTRGRGVRAPNDIPPQAALDYARIEKAIAYLQANFLGQPDLATLARAVHLSEYHLQRLFTRWAGISPKRFLQCLTVEHAKYLLAQSKAVLETTLDSGLTSPGRLHDLFVSVEAVTPGEFKTRGAGIHIDYGFHLTPFGTCLLGLTPRGICWLSFPEPGHQKPALDEMRSYWSGANIAENPAATASLATRVFTNFTQPLAAASRQNHPTPLSLLVMGTNFQLMVWRALLRIPPGALVSYETLAQTVEAPHSCRAIGSAVGQNAVAYLIPCHRVIRKTGLLGGYRWGQPRKQAMLAWETARIES